MHFVKELGSSDEVRIAVYSTCDDCQEWIHLRSMPKAGVHAVKDNGLLHSGGLDMAYVDG